MSAIDLFAAEVKPVPGAWPTAARSKDINRRRDVCEWVTAPAAQPRLLAVENCGAQRRESLPDEVLFPAGLSSPGSSRPNSNPNFAILSCRRFATFDGSCAA